MTSAQANPNDPSLALFRSAMMSELDERQQQLVIGWLGMEAVERGEESIYKLAKDFMRLRQLESNLPMVE